MHFEEIKKNNQFEANSDIRTSNNLSSCSALNVSPNSDWDLNKVVSELTNWEFGSLVQSFPTNYAIIKDVEMKRIIRNSVRIVQLSSLPAIFKKYGLDALSDSLIYDYGLTLNNLLKIAVCSDSSIKHSRAESIEEILNSSDIKPKISLSNCPIAIRSSIKRKIKEVMNNYFTLFDEDQTELISKSLDSECEGDYEDISEEDNGEELELLINKKSDKLASSVSLWTSNKNEHQGITNPELDSQSIFKTLEWSLCLKKCNQESIISVSNCNHMCHLNCLKCNKFFIHHQLSFLIIIL